jgi:hypothetical protein
VETTLIFEIVHASTFLSQTRQDTDRSGLLRAVSSLVSARIKEIVLGNLTSEQLHRGLYAPQGESLNDLISTLCNFEKNFGVVLAQSPITEVRTLNERVQNAFDINQAKRLFREVSNEYADAFNDYKKRLPQGVDDNVALAFFNTSRENQGLPPVTMNMVKLN